MPVKKLKPRKLVAFDDEISLVDHLDELRGRIVTSLVAFAAAGVLTYWQSDQILEFVNRPLDGREPITLSPTEPFITTLTVSGYAALLLTMPIILYQVYAFVLPAFSPTERRVALPLLLMIPFLFIGGVAFCYFIVLPPALDFLLGFNPDQFNAEVRAKDYYSFVVLTLISLGLLFQVPVGILAATKLGITTPEKLRKNRRFAVVGIAAVAALLPTIDPVTLLLEMIPLLILYELSIVLASVLGRPSPEVAERLASVES